MFICVRTCSRDVRHPPVEAMTLGDRVGGLIRGGVSQGGPPGRIDGNPRTWPVAADGRAIHNNARRAGGQ